MKQKIFRTLAIVAGVLAYLAVSVIISGYGNKRNHPTINSFIVEAFEARNNMGSLNSMAEFKNYLFMLDNKQLKGTGVTKEGLFHPSNSPAPGNYPISYHEEGSLTMTPKEWIKHGGMSADVPEVPASLRHFYDPTKPDGERYLKDNANGRLMAFAQSLMTNPRIDGVEWAIGQQGSLGSEEHNYTWENGKKWMKMALEEKDADKRNEYLANSWRSLGETLHMIADHGCPSHVRDDAHPSPFWTYNDIFGDPDPYEELMDMIQSKSSSEFMAFNSGNADASFKSSISSLSRIRDIAHAMAVFTNQNFFTDQTISGTNWQGNTVEPLIHKDYVYNSPKISGDIYSNGFYIKDIGNQQVKLCTDLWYFAKFVPYKGRPHIEVECVKSQATVLIPNIVEAGVRAMRIYIPKLKIEITELKDDGSIKGTITHTTDDEYNTAIKYNGPVVLQDLGTREIGKLEANDGKFEGKIEGSFTDVRAAIDFGGIQVASEYKQVTFDILPELQKTIYSYGILNTKIDYKRNDGSIFEGGRIEIKNTYTGAEIEWGGTSFSKTYSFKTGEGLNSYSETEVSISGDVSPKGDKILNCVFSFKEKHFEGSFCYMDKSMSLSAIEIPYITKKSDTNYTAYSFGIGAQEMKTNITGIVHTENAYSPDGAATGIEFVKADYDYEFSEQSFIVIFVRPNK